MLDGDAAGVDAAFASATGPMPWDIALMKVISAQIVGGPYATRWLREALDFYEHAGAIVEVDRTRQLLRDAGGRLPRRRRPSAIVPEPLARQGVTAREADVLRLLGDGLSNAAIAERLYLSVRTVETYVSSLLAKLHLTGRGQLTALSVSMAHPDRADNVEGGRTPA
jgi:DNA-binding NarL/FixJ family response regulator